MANLLDFIPDLKREGREYHGPCPYCGGGTDRFMVFPKQGREETGRFYCRQCRETGDAIDFLRDIRGMAYPEAVEALGVKDVPALRFDKGDDELTRRRRRREKALAEASDEDKRRMLREDTVRDVLERGDTRRLARSLRSALEQKDEITAGIACEILAHRALLLERIAQRYHEAHPGQFRCFVESQAKCPEVWGWGAFERERTASWEPWGAWRDGEGQPVHDASEGPFTFHPNKAYHDAVERGEYVPPSLVAFLKRNLHQAVPDQ